VKSNNSIFTIGHSTYEVDKFVDILQDFDIDTIVDVRSVPYSQFASNYNRENIKSFLIKNNFTYIYMGDMIGGKGIVDYKYRQTQEIFLQGISRLKDGLDRGYKIALMCGEKEPYDCHRFNLIGDYLITQDIQVLHIINKDNNFEYINHLDYISKIKSIKEQKTLFDF
jgi:uncharacterized protein (DUF488 family)